MPEGPRCVLQASAVFVVQGACTDPRTFSSLGPHVQVLGPSPTVEKKGNDNTTSSTSTTPAAAHRLHDEQPSNSNINRTAVAHRQQHIPRCHFGPQVPLWVHETFQCPHTHPSASSSGPRESWPHRASIKPLLRRPRENLRAPTLVDLRSLRPRCLARGSGSRCQSLRDLKALQPQRQLRLPLRALQALLPDSHRCTSVCLQGLLPHSQPRLACRTCSLHLQALLPQRHLRLRP